VLAGVAALAVGAAGAALVFTSNHEDSPWLTASFAITAGVSFALSGLVAMWRRPENATGWLMTAVGFTWFLGALTEANSDWVFTIGLLLSNTAFVAFAWLVLAYPTGRLEGRVERLVIAVTAAAIMGGTALTVLLDPTPSTDCDACRSTIVVWHRPGLAHAIDNTSSIVGVGIIVTIIVILARRWQRATPALRRALSPVCLTGGVSLAILALSLGVDALFPAANQAFSAVFLAAFAAVPLAFLFGVLRLRLARSSAASMFMSLEEGAPLRDALARALGDPSVTVAYRVESRSGWVDPDGRSVPDPAAAAGRTVTQVTRGGNLIAALSHDSTLDAEPELVQAVANAAGLSLHNERLQAELRAQYGFLETIVKTAPSLLVVLGLDGRIVSCNLAAGRASGLDDPTEILGRVFWDVFIDPDERAATRARFEAAAPYHPPGEYETDVFTNARGELLAIAWQSAPVLGEDGTVMSIVTGGVDVTVRRRRELELERERDATATVIESIPSLTVVADLDGVIVDRDLGNPLAAVNRAFRETLQWADDRLVGHSLLDFAHPEDTERARAAIMSAAAGAPSSELESRWHRADGTYVHVEWSATPVTDTTGRRPGLVLVSGSETTERRARNLELQRQRDFADTIHDTIPSYLVAMDHDAVIVAQGVNRAFTTRFGWGADELAARSFMGVIAPVDDHAARIAIANAANGVPQPEQESRWLCRDGTSRIVAWTTTPITDQQGRELVIVSGADVTERKEQEEEIRASRTRIIGAGDDARRRLERNLHDGAQQRLVSLSVSLRLAETRLATDPDEAAAILGAARGELAAALDELRELARGIHPAVLTDRGLAAAVEALVTRTPFPVEVEMPSQRLEPAVEAAAYYVVSEALTNVAKYAQASSARVHVRETADRVVVIEVTDDGAGGADPAGGTGLRGLADRIEALNGTLSVESPPGSGTRILAEIPVRKTVPTGPAG
jgi:PAS domain S-box-containing protein